jgi:hypothetical protein
MLTYLLIGINVVVSLIGFSRLNGVAGDSMFFFSPSEVSAGRNYEGMLLSHFAHADGSHLLFNMVTLFSFRPRCRDGFGLTEHAADLRERGHRLYSVCLLSASLGSEISGSRRQRFGDRNHLRRNCSHSGEECFLLLCSDPHSRATVRCRLYRPLDLFDATRWRAYQSRGTHCGRDLRIASRRIARARGIRPTP